MLKTVVGRERPKLLAKDRCNQMLDLLSDVYTL